MIKRIKIRDFKSIRELELELDPVTVLVGRSGTGKSNVVRAIRFLRNLLLNYQQAVNYEGGWGRIVPEGEETPQPSLEVIFSVPGEEWEYSYAVVFGLLAGPPTFQGLMRMSAERLSLGEEIIFSRVREPRTNWAWAKSPKVTPVPVHEDGPILGSFPSLQQVVFANAALSTGIGFYHLPSTTLALRTAPVQGQEFLQQVPGLADNAGNYLQIMRGITQDFHHPDIRKNILASLRKINPAIESVELDSLQNAQKAIIGHKAANRIFALALEQESDGFRRFYAHLLALYQTPPKLTLLFEEPENAIFPGALSLLADEFNAAPRENRGQVILTTHSPALLDSFNVDHLRVVEMRDGKTVVGPISREQRQAVKDHLLTTGELLTVDPARLDEEAAAQPA
jgi:predicted ATPase